jgi:hypothetical protein
MMRADEMAQAVAALARSLRLIDIGRRRASAPLRIEESTPARPSGVDRLAQLTRLIEQDETLAAIVREGKSEQRADLSLRGEEPPSSQLAREDKVFEHDWEDEAGSALVHPGSCDEPAREPHDAPDYGEYDNPDYSNGLPDQRRGLKVFAALIGLILAGSASAFAYWTLSDRRGRGDEARVVATSISPEKTAPSPLEHSRADERFDDKPEERSVNATGRATTGAEEPADAKPPPPQTLPPMDIVVGPAPTKVAALAPAPTLPGNPADTAQNRPPDVRKPKPRRRVPVATVPRGAHGVRYDVQLSSERSEAAARVRSLVLQTTYTDVLADRKLFIRRADLGERGVYYRVQMGPFAIGEANQICGDLRKSGADCIVQRN